jgi:16S rRNA (guanine527-N7)-methyltransferase
MGKEIAQDDQSIIRKGAEALGVKLSDEALSLLIAYCEEVEFWNRIAGITAYRTRKKLLVYMFLDSIAPMALIQSLSHDQVLDMGTGGGFPGLPCRILCPTMALTLLDSSTKKAEFLRNMVKKLKVGGVRVLCEEAGKLTKMVGEKEHYNLILSRAFASLSEIVRLAAPLLSGGGRIMAWKGPGVKGEIEESLPACKDSGMEREELFRYTLPFVNQEMNIAVLRKRN